LKRANGNAEKLGEPRLRETGTFANGSDGRHGDDAAVLAALDLANALKNFHADVSFALSHRFPP
jgi:hypothetical protein